jgi:hypothetical protein
MEGVKVSIRFGQMREERDWSGLGYGGRRLTLALYELGRSSTTVYVSGCALSLFSAHSLHLHPPIIEKCSHSEAYELWANI